MIDCKMKCKRVPIPNECVRTCIFLTLSDATKDEKRYILHIDQPLIDKIYNAFKNNKWLKSFDDLEVKLDPTESEILVSIFLSLTQTQLDHFSKSKKKRNEIIKTLKDNEDNKGFNSARE